jgi:hypothetical protein
VVKRRASPLIAATLTLFVVACQLLAGIEDRSVADGGSDAATPDATHDAGRDTGPSEGHDAGREAAAKDAGSESSMACIGVVPPSAPTSNTTSQSITFVTALRTLWYSSDTDAGSLGFNLDHDCTCEGEPPGPPSCQNDASPPTCDSDGGRDIAGNTLLTEVDGVLGGRTVSATFDSKIQNGQFTVIFEIGGYDLGADDEEVTVTAYVSGGLAIPDGGSNVPKWDGTDVWTVDPRSVSSAMPSDAGWEYVPIYVGKGYVKDGTLVSKLGSVSLGIGQGSISLSDTVLVASIQPDFVTGGQRLTGQIAGRVSVGSIFSVASTFPDPVIDGGYLCGDDPTFQTIRSVVCASADIMADAAADNAGQDCNAISLSFGFTATRVVVGGPQEGLNPLLGCDGSVATCSP